MSSTTVHHEFKETHRERKGLILFLLLLLFAWIYFLFPKNLLCSKLDSVPLENNFSPATNSALAESVDSSHSDNEEIELMIYGGNIEMINVSLPKVNEKVEFLYNGADVYSSVDWLVDDQFQMTSKEKDEVFSYRFSQPGQYVIKVVNQEANRIDTHLVVVVEDLSFDGPKMNVNKALFNPNIQAVRKESDLEANKLLNKNTLPKTEQSIDKDSKRKVISDGSTQSAREEKDAIEDNSSKKLVELDAENDDQKKIGNLAEGETSSKSENQLEIKSSEENNVVSANDESNKAKYKTKNAASDAPPEEEDKSITIDQTKKISGVEKEGVNSEVQFNEDNRTFDFPSEKEIIDAISLADLLMMVARRGNEEPGIEVEQGATWAIKEIGTMTAPGNTLVQRKLLINNKEEYFGQAQPLSHLLDDLYLRKNLIENIIQEIEVSEITYDKSGKITGFSYSILK